MEELIQDIDNKLDEINIKNENLKYEYNLVQELANSTEAKFLRNRTELLNITLKEIKEDFKQSLQNLLTIFDRSYILENEITRIENKIIKSRLSNNQKANKFDESICKSLTTCRKCIDMPLCGWCEEQNRCVLGDEIGSFKNEKCKNYNFAQCKDDCFSSFTCSECISRDDNCKWCISTNKCFSVEKSGSAFCENTIINESKEW